MAWIVLFISGAFEAVWASALDRSEGLTRLGPALVFAVGLVVSMGGLAWALRTIPLGTGYAVWVGVGATLTAAYSFATGQEPVTSMKVLCLLLVVGGIAGLKALG